MGTIADFVAQHINDDTSKLLLNAGKWPEVDMELAVNCIESRRKLRGKLNEWYMNPDLIFPVKLSAEQCSSSATGKYKAELAQRIITETSADGFDGTWRIADLTGGLGADSWFFSQFASEVLYNEMNTVLCNATEHNFNILNASNIIVSNHAVVPSESINGTDGQYHASPGYILQNFKPDMIYMDPARRGEGGKKVFLIEECSPDILSMKEELLSICRHLLVKLSPMADISMVCSRIGNCCREVHVTATGGECKELLIWIDREWDSEYTITAAELPSDYPASPPATFRFSPSEEKAGRAVLAEKSDAIYFFEPGKALMKAGAFNLISERFSLKKLGKSTHYYMIGAETESRIVQNLSGLGKLYEIADCRQLDKRSIREVGKNYPEAEVTARNIPMDTDTLRKRLGVRSGNGIHVFGLRSDLEGNLLITAKRSQVTGFPDDQKES